MPFRSPECRIYYGQGMVCFGIVNAGQSEHLLKLSGFDDHWERFGR
jgi:hypothetical protein